MVLDFGVSVALLVFVVLYQGRIDQALIAGAFCWVLSCFKIFQLAGSSEFAILYYYISVKVCLGGKHGLGNLF